MKAMGRHSPSSPISGLRVLWMRRRADIHAAALAAPLVLFLSMAAVFRVAVALCGRTAGYSVAFGVYWILWGLLVPVMLLGWPAVRGLYRDVRPRLGTHPWLGCALLATPILGGFLVAFLPHVRELTGLVLAVAIARAGCNALAEEIFWRGVYVRLFPGDLVRGYLYPALAFAAWHVIPQSVVPFGGGSAALVLGACFIGLGYGWIAWRTGSIRWTTLAHFATDALGVGAALVALGR
jgi:uncharacterized protein